ncbi:hypothetical protein DNU06_16850 [Putridiphycobacter roseus]|uniref:Outer membrane protein beta-barrel domain-containing protein n=1 Tax=Putridiphycobacter roseus TaxID=2219161 RepID=A0A2W1N8U7_9FLAO|nr:hypothetical protein [Putridiphycobacter roseus]PZE15675.1 hypothetical protein DNU06_16850 [Putridiphycobacter roseus]
MQIIYKIGFLISFLLSLNLLFSQESTRVELFIQGGIEHSFIKYIPEELNPPTSGWRTSQEKNGNFNMTNSVGLNFNTKRKIQIQTGISYSNPSFDALDANVVHTVSIGELSLGFLPYSEKRDYQIKFRFFQLNIGVGVPIKLSNKLSIIIGTSATIKLLSDYKYKSKYSYETWKDIDFIQNNSFVFTDLPIFGIVTSAKARYRLNETNPNGVNLSFGLNYSYDFSSLSSWGNDFLFRAIGFNVGLIIPFQKKKI